MIINYINAIIFGVIQGITEFLPISSSGHLIILHDVIKLPISDSLTFDVILHLATLLAVVWFFRNDLLVILKDWFNSLSGEKTEKSKLGWLIILATIPAVVFAILADDLIETKFRSSLVVAVMLILVGILFIVIEKVSRKTDELNSLSWKKSLVVGFAQAIALIPGTSRSGITIIAGMGAGLKREAAIRFSFLISIPIIAAASIKKIPNSFGMSLSTDEIIILVLAFAASFITGFLTIKYFLKLSKNLSLNIFAYYRFVLAIIILVSIFI